MQLRAFHFRSHMYPRSQLRSNESEFRKKLASLDDALEQSREESRQLQRMLVQVRPVFGCDCDVATVTRSRWFDLVSRLNLTRNRTSANLMLEILPTRV
jgi:hypothetical protein